MEQITDSHVTEKYNYLGESIRNWIDKVVSAYEDRGGDLSMVQ